MKRSFKNGGMSMWALRLYFVLFRFYQTLACDCVSRNVGTI